MQKGDLVRLHHMLDAAMEALHFAQDKTRDSLDSSSQSTRPTQSGSDGFL
jgi:hypothetical protein